MPNGHLPFRRTSAVGSMAAPHFHDHRLSCSLPSFRLVLFHGSFLRSSTDIALPASPSSTRAVHRVRSPFGSSPSNPCFTHTHVRQRHAASVPSFFLRRHCAPVVHAHLHASTPCSVDPRCNPFPRGLRGCERCNGRRVNGRNRVSTGPGCEATGEGIFRKLLENVGSRGLSWWMAFCVLCIASR